MSGDQNQFDFTDPRPEFDGATYDPAKDWKRLSTLLGKVWQCMSARDPGEDKSLGWWTLRELHLACGGSEASISARLRDFRKAKFGGHEVLRRRRAGGGTWEYAVLPAEVTT
jgi:hypothetical protein